MRLQIAGLVLILSFGATAFAENAYVSDKLVVGVYATASSEGERLAQLSTGDTVEVLAREGEFTQVKLGDGREGWIKSSYLANDPPAAARLSALQAENQKLKAAAEKPAAASAADARKLADLQKALDAARAELATRAAAPPAAAPVSTPANEEALPIEPIGADQAYRRKAWIWGTVVALLTFGIGFAVGWLKLDRKIRARYGGLRVY